MTQRDAIAQVLSQSPKTMHPRVKLIGGVLIAAGIGGVALGFFGPEPGAGWAALLVATSLVIGLAVCGVVFSAIFQLSGARWGRGYRRLAEASVVLMPIGLLGIVALLAGGGAYLPWAHAHHLVGGKAVWLTRGFWDARVVLALAVCYGLSLAFLYYSLRQDFCRADVRKRFDGPIAAWVGKNIDAPASEAKRCDARMSVLAPIVLISYALMFSLLGFDLIMALEPDWFSTLFGAWYFIGHLFSGLALLAIVSIALRRRLGLEPWLSELRQRDLATVLFGFCLINMDFFWSQYLTIWYANMPEETGYLIRRALDEQLPWHNLAWVALSAFFFIPFVALLFRKVKHSSALLTTVAAIVVAGIFLARFIEVAPPLLGLRPPATAAAVASPLIAAVLVFGGMLGGGLLLYHWFITKVPIMPVGDEVFLRTYCADEEGGHG